MTNHQLEKDVGCKVLQFINTMKITKLLGYKTLRRTNQQLLEEKDELGQIVKLLEEKEKKSYPKLVQSEADF